MTSEHLPSCWETLPRCDDLEQATLRGARIANASAHDDRNLCSAR